MKTLQKMMIAAIAAASVAAPALADDDARHYEQNRSQYISYEQAADAALQAVGRHGRVTDIEFDRDFNGDHFEVEVLVDGREYDVVIDAKTGKVISSREDR